MKIRIIASKPNTENGVTQDEIKEYIGTEWEVIEKWQENIKPNSRNWNGLEKGQVSVILKSKNDPNPRNQISILNAEEYVFIN